jgi:SAM-dependent methyltransferase
MINSFRSDCPSCGGNQPRLFHHVSHLPVNSVLNISSQKEALNFPQGEMALSHCRQCGFIFNAAFDERKVQYSSQCEESQGYSDTFNAFALDLTHRLIEKYNLRNKKIIEIGCGKGEFLKMICRLGENSGVGFDPAYVPGRGESEGNRSVKVEFIKDYYSEKYADYCGDMICCRMTLEHIQETAKFVRAIRRSIGDRKDTIVFFQVPDVIRIMKDCAFEDIYYEHCSYFSPGSIARLFRANHFDILNISVEFAGQYILIEAKPVSHQTIIRLDLENDIDRLEELVLLFVSEYPAVVRYWEQILERINEENRRVVIWGSGSKGVSFLNSVRNSGHVKYVVDINPFRQGTFMAGTGHEIVSPEFLKAYQPETVIVMNPVYLNEIKGDLKQMGLDPEIHAMGEKRIEI